MSRAEEDFEVFDIHAARLFDEETAVRFEKAGDLINCFAPVGDVGRWNGHVIIYDPNAGPELNAWSALRLGKNFQAANVNWFTGKYGVVN